MSRLWLGQAILATATAHSLRARGSDASAAAAVQDADRELKDFWGTQWGGLETDLERFRDIATEICRSGPTGPAPRSSGAASAMQLGKTPVINVTKAAPVAKEVAFVKPQNASGRQVNATEAAAGKREASAAVAAAPGGGQLPPEAQKLMLKPMLEMLKALYEQGRTRIGNLNKREAKSKKDFAEKVAKHKEKLLKFNSTKNHLSAEFRANQTRDENRMWVHYERSRDLQHRQYHNMLKMQHSMMSKTKTMIDMYEKTINGKGSTTMVKKELHTIGADLPEVVFIQAAQEARDFCLSSLLEAQRGHLEVKRSGQDWVF